MTTIPIAISRYALLIATVLSLVAAEAASAKPAAVNATTVPPVTAGDARIWIYRDYLPSESLNPATVSINGTETGYAQAAGGVFYRDAAARHYLVAVNSYGRDHEPVRQLVVRRPVREVVGASHHVTDLTLGLGEVVFDYLKDA